MTTASLLQLALVICAVMALTMTNPTQARSLDEMGLPWLDQTIFLPGCTSLDCACACRSQRFCLPDCVW